jgi:hypothetical protein
MHDGEAKLVGGYRMAEIVANIFNNGIDEIKEIS